MVMMSGEFVHEYGYYQAGMLPILAPSNPLPPRSSIQNNLACTSKGCIMVGPPSCSDLKKEAATYAAGKVTLDGLSLIPGPQMPELKVASWASAALAGIDTLRIAFGGCIP
jgi:hypothetical protein